MVLIMVHIWDGHADAEDADDALIYKANKRIICGCRCDADDAHCQKLPHGHPWYISNQVWYLYPQSTLYNSQPWYLTWYLSNQVWYLYPKSTMVLNLVLVQSSLVLISLINLI